MVSGILQSLINCETWGSWVEGDDLLAIAFLGAITKKILRDFGSKKICRKQEGTSSECLKVFKS